MRYPMKVVLALAVSVSLAGCLVGSPLPWEEPEPPQLTVGNQDATPYEVTAFVVHGIDSTAGLEFEAIDTTGERHRFEHRGGPHLYTHDSYAELTVVDASADTLTFTAPPSTETVRTLSDWRPGDIVVYVIDGTTGDRAPVVTVSIVDCPRGGQEHVINVDDRQQNQSVHTCG